MKRIETPCNAGSARLKTKYSYNKVLNSRKHPVRGLWKRNGEFFARLTVEDDLGRKEVRWIRLEAETAPQAIEALKQKQVERKERRLHVVGRAPTLSAYIDTYVERLAHSGKKRDTITTEKSHLSRWKESLGHLRLNQLRPSHVTSHLHELKKAGLHNRTVNLSLVTLRNVLKAAKVDGWIKTLPVEGIPWLRTEKKSRKLFAPADIDAFCEAALETRYFKGRLAREDEEPQPLKNGRQFVDYLRFLQYTGARESEALLTRWEDVDFDNRQVRIGWDGDTKNRESRVVDFNPQLEAHLKDMSFRRAPDSTWLFPSPQRGERDVAAKTFRESLLLTRLGADMPGFGFHDLRHHFISYCVMAGIDYLTVAKWVGHKDGGILIGKTYGHLSNEHAQQQAARLSFGPQVVGTERAATR